MPPMKKDAEIASFGAVSGIAAMAAAIWVITTRVLPAPIMANTASERFSYVLGAELFALAPLALMFLALGNSRFVKKLILPKREMKSTSIRTDAAVIGNTLQQNFIFLVALLALAAVVPLPYVQSVWSCAIVFVGARCAFWLGSRVDPLYRAPGLSATVYLNIGIILFVLVRLAALFFASS
jgi:hypothetical protein